MSLFSRHIAKLLPSLTWRHFGVGALQAYLSEDGRLEQRLHIWHPSLIREGIQGRGDCHNHRFSFVSQVLCGAIVNETWDLRAFETGDYALYEVEHARAALQRTGSFDCAYRLVTRCHAAPQRRELIEAGDSYEFERGSFHRSSCLGMTVTLVTKFDQKLRYWSCGHRRSPEVGSPLVPCPACGEQMHRNRNHWAALTVAIVLALLLVCAMAGGGR